MINIMSIRYKLVLGAIVIVLIPAVWIGITVDKYITKTIEQASADTARKGSRTAALTYDGFQQNAVNITVALSSHPDLIKALQKSDRNELRRVMVAAYQDLSDQNPLLKTLEITDEKGIVQLRGHNPDKFGDDKNDHPMVSAALNGRLNSGVTISHTTLAVAVDSVAPIKESGRVIGTIKAGFYLDQDMALHIKTKSELDVLFFFKREDGNIVMTSSTLGKVEGPSFKHIDGLVKDSKTHKERRTVLTVLSKNNAVNRVLKDGRPAVGILKISGVPYNVTYLPLTDSDGHHQGLILSALSRKQLVAAQEEHSKRIFNIVVLAVAISIGLALYFAFGISRPVRLTMRAAQRLANGDLTVKELRVRRRDEIGDMARAVNQMVGNFRELIRQTVLSSGIISSSGEQLREATKQVALVSHQVNQSMEQLAQGATVQAESSATANEAMEKFRAVRTKIEAGAQEQSRSAKGLSENMDQMVASIQGVAQNADRVAASSQDAAKTAEEGSRVVEKTVTGIGCLRQTVLGAAARIEDLSGYSEQIGKITKVITDIADMTNLLALNAAIEASRAGEHGRGFAVVADEVRKLAEGARKSANEITELIHSIQDSASKSAIAMNQSTEEAEKWANQAAEAGKALGQILTVVNEMTRDVQGIAAASQDIAAVSQEMAKSVSSVVAIIEENSAATKEMAAGLDQGTRSVGEIAAISQENAAATEEVSASIQEVSASIEDVAASTQNLAEVAQDLQRQISKFSLNSDDKSGSKEVA